jgi:2-C-methyl-D-erythritol 2,4-cyclodiphosphate synthase
MRVGIGYDTHAFVEGRPLFLGGVRIPYAKGLIGHSDADVLLHAISDAVLGAAGLPDIGVYFPNTDQSIAGMGSDLILARATSLAREQGFEVASVDSVIVCEAPKIQPYREEMRSAIARIMGIDVGRINVKGKTTEGLGFTGRGEGIESYAVCLLDEVSRG